MISAIIFDCFGVLVTSSYEPFKLTYFKGDRALIKHFTEIENRSSRGEITLDEAEEEFAKLAGISFRQAKDELSNNPRSNELLELIENNLKPNYKIGMLSNVADDRIGDLFSQDDMELFDDILLSYQVGLAKPDKRIYELAAERLGVKPEYCLFIDDIETYVEAAKQVGMQAIHYTTYDKFIHDIDSLL